MLTYLTFCGISTNEKLTVKIIKKVHNIKKKYVKNSSSDTVKNWLKS